jgi:hypothetical protein
MEEFPYQPFWDWLVPTKASHFLEGKAQCERHVTGSWLVASF